MMRKLLLCCLAAIILVMPVCVAFAGADTANFSHPEVGEFMTVWIVDGYAYFEIYGFTYYSILDPATPYRGMYVNQLQLLNERNVNFDKSVELLMGTIDNPDYPALSEFTCGGAASAYNEQISKLDLADKIKALRIINGFDGLQGFDQLKTIPGFEQADINALKDTYIDYYVTIDGVRYPYRAQVFFFEERDDLNEYYNEKYGYVFADGEWKLIRITKEYADEYKQRSPYIHGISGSMPDMLQETNDEAMRGTRFGMSLSEAEQVLGIQAKDGVITINEDKLYRLPCKAVFRFENEQLSKVEYEFDNSQCYYSAFISLYIRYNDPVTLNRNGDMTWCQNEMTLQLNYDENAPTLSFVPAE